MITIGASHLTSENMSYLVNAFSMHSSGMGNEFSRVDFAYNLNTVTSVLDNTLFVVNEKELNAYNSYGEILFTNSQKRANPRILSSENYLLVYDDNGYECSLYNVFGAIKSLDFDKPITGGAIADNGYFAILSKTLTTRSAVFVYDNMGNLIVTINSTNTFLMSVAISADGKTVATLGVDINERAELIARTTVYNISEKATVGISNEVFSMPVGIRTIEDGFITVTQEHMVFTDNKGLQKWKYELSSPQMFTVNGSVMAVLESNGALLTYIDNSGIIIRGIQVENRAKSLLVSGQTVYILYGDNIIIYKGASKESYMTADSAKSLLLTNNGGVLVVYEGYALNLSRHNKIN